MYGALAAVERPVGDSTDERLLCFLDYNFYDVRIGRNGTEFNCTFYHFQLVVFTFKFRLRITYQKILMTPNCGVAIYIVCKLISR